MSEDPILARRVAVLSMEYVAHVFRALGKVYGDGREGLIVQAIFAANTAHLDVRTTDPSIAGPDAVLPDDVRRPISVSRLARSLGLPFETTRQHVNRLIDAGLCVRVRGGVIVPKASVQRPEVAGIVMANLDVVRKLVRDLQAVGLEVHPRPQSPAKRAAADARRVVPFKAVSEGARRSRGSLTGSEADTRRELGDSRDG
jgi:hypothetical protein